MKKRRIRYSENLKHAHEQIVINHLRAEWEQAERALRKHELIEKAKHAGLGVGKWLLALGLMAGALTIVAAAPNAFAAVGKVSGGNRRKYMSLSSRALNAQLSRGSSKKYWHYKKIAPETYTVTLTKFGRQIALRAQLQKFRLHSQPTWDGKWRMVMFDIPKKYSSTRDALRRKLLEIGMHRLQESIFIYPYPCEDEVEMWVELYGMGECVAQALAQFDPYLTNEFKRPFKLNVR